MDRRMLLGVLLAGSLLAAALLSPAGAHGVQHLESTSPEEPALHAINRRAGGAAILAESSTYGVQATGGVGVFGGGRTGVLGSGLIGVTGESRSLGGFGVRARGLNGATALDVEGPARFRGPVSFSHSGQGTIERGNRSHAVANRGLESSDLVLVTLLADAGNGSLDWVEREPGEGFVVHLTRRAQRAVPFAYLILEAR